MALGEDDVASPVGILGADPGDVAPLVGRNLGRPLLDGDLAVGVHVAARQGAEEDVECPGLLVEHRTRDLETSSRSPFFP
jgi:hypothetical protein